MKKTKIVCTIGPSSDQPEILDAMLRAGMNVARFNFSHGSHAEHKQRIEAVRAASVRTGIPVALMLDTKGPEIRLGLFEQGKIEMKEQQPFILTSRPIMGNETIASMNYSRLPQEVKAGDHILLSDGLVNLEVTAVQGEDIHTVILNSGTMSDRKRVAVPGVAIQLPVVSESDLADIKFGIEMGMDFIAASFIQRGEDIIQIRKILEAANSPMQIISKVECWTAVENITDIVALSDGIMVARGDLGVEVPAEEVPLLQKMMIRKCRIAGKPVITATQMLESMCSNPRPTRAETSDVANAIIDGSDAIMLSGETASGLYPVEAVQTMAIVAKFTEDNVLPKVDQTDFVRTGATTTDSIGKATVVTAENLKVAAILASTETGKTAKVISKYRPVCPVIAVSPREYVVRQLQLFWGVQPVLGEAANTSDEVVDKAMKASLGQDLIKPGDLVVLTAGVPVRTAGSTNMIRVQVAGDAILHGMGVGKRLVTGPVCIVTKRGIDEKNFIDGSIMVVRSVESEWFPLMKRAGAIISEEEGITCPSAIAAGSLGIPGIIGARNAVDELTNGEIITVDSVCGTIYRGEMHASC